MFTAAARTRLRCVKKVNRTSPLSTRFATFGKSKAHVQFDPIFSAGFKDLLKGAENMAQPSKFPLAPSLTSFTFPPRAQKSQYSPEQLKRMRLVRKRLEKRFSRILSESPEGTGLKAFLDSTPESKCPREFVPILCHTALQQYESRKQFKNAYSLFLQMDQNGIKKNTKAYSVLIPMFARKNVLSDDVKGKKMALSLFQEMKDNHVASNMVIYNTILYTHNRLGQPYGLEAIFEEIDRAGIKNPQIRPNKSTFGHIIDYFSKNQQVDRALDYFEDMKKRGIPATLIIYSNIINMFVKMGQTQRAIPLFEEMRERKIADVIVYNLWIEVAAKQDDHVKVMDLFNEMHANRITHDVTTYNLVIDVCGQRQERRRVEDLFAEMKARRLFPDTLTYTALIAMYSTLDPEKAVATLEEMKGYGIAAIPRTYNVLIEMYAKFRWPAKAIFLFTEMKELGVLPDVHTYALLINMYRLIFQREKALEFFEEMKASGIEPNQRVLDLIAKVKLQRVPDVYLSHFVEMQNRGIQANVDTYNQSIADYATKAELFKAFADFLEMRDYGIRRNLQTFKSLIQLFFDQRRLQEIPDVFAEMKMEAVNPDIDLINQVLTVYAELGYLQEALVLWEETKQPNSQTFSILIEFLGPRKPALAIAFYDQMKTKGFEASVQAQNALIQAFASVDRVPDAEKVFQSLKTSKTADSETLLIMNDIYTSHPEKARSLIEELFSSNINQVCAE